MKEAALWAGGGALAFFVAAGAFLLLANLATGPSEKRLPPDPRPVGGAGSGSPALELDLDEDQLAALAAAPDQRLDVGVVNAGDEPLVRVRLTVKVLSENTARPDTRSYRATVDRLAAGGSTTARFDIDLSAEEATGPPAPEPPSRIVEVRGAAPTGASAVKTAILPV